MTRNVTANTVPSVIKNERAITLFGVEIMLQTNERHSIPVKNHVIDWKEATAAAKLMSVKAECSLILDSIALDALPEIVEREPIEYKSNSRIERTARN